MVEEREKRVDNQSYKERFQFVLSVNDNIICQRYFKIGGFDKESLASVDLRDVLDNAVCLIQDDLKEKSKIYTYYTTPSTEIQLTGFGTDGPFTVLHQGPVSEEERAADPMLEAYDVVFKFEFLVDDRPIYTRIWDGTQYPKYIRNGVDITNSDAAYRDRKDEELGFNISLLKKMTMGRKDLVYEIIRSICDVCNHSYSENNGGYITVDDYGDVEYSLNPQRDYINSWWEYTKKKTRDYFYSSSKNGFSQN